MCTEQSLRRTTEDFVSHAAQKIDFFRSLLERDCQLKNGKIVPHAGHLRRSRLTADDLDDRAPVDMIADPRLDFKNVVVPPQGGIPNIEL